jgi:hypothetical protein
METFAPEFAQYWLKGQSKGAGDVEAEGRDGDANAQQAALEELAERVTAARSVI